MTGGPYLPPEMRRTLGGQVFEEMLRVDPQLRAVYARPGAGGVSFAVRPEDMGAVLEALRALPDDAGAEAARSALAPFLVAEPLVSLAKPVACVALGIGGILAVGAWTTEPPREATPGVFERVRADRLE